MNLELKDFNTKLYEDDGWTLERNENGEEYFTHPYSELRFPVSHKQFRNENFVPVPQYLRETDVPGNSISR